MKLIRIIKEYFKGNLIVVVKGKNKKFSYIQGDNVDKRFILNSFTEIIKMNI